MPIKVDSARTNRKKGKSAPRNGGHDSPEITKSAVITASPSESQPGTRERIDNAINERNAFLTAIVENNPLASVVLDSDNKVQLCNPAFERLFRYPLDEIAGCDVDDFIAPPALAAEAADFSCRTLAGESV
ncbi:MAG TPA: PAS domain-containing protein, partial [Candidatus Acidoferrales bacterium]|nr:PAS domain-containing protein [Candidatus Acidoferrales bacterium]